MICFGPIPSRRLGKSLGINNIPDRKICSYSCIYCQVGAKQKLSCTREPFYEPWVIRCDVEKILEKLDENSTPDFLTFVANGEPTLDIKLGKAIKMLKAFKIPIAVLTNASLLSEKRVQDDLMYADWVSVKVDTAEQEVWKAINRPHQQLNYNNILKGILEFSEKFEGTLTTETMLVDGINDKGNSIVKTASYILQINPSKAYISIPTRPPAISWVQASNELAINQAYQTFNEKGINTELIMGFEGTDVGFSGNAKDDILNISAVHPIREDTMQDLLDRNNADFGVVEELIYEQKIKEINYKSKKFYLRKHQL
ncbi:MAG: radical SAM protein [Bacteroidales bacterium]